MFERKLFKLQLRKLVQLTTPACQKVIYKYTDGLKKKKKREKSGQVTTSTSTSHLYINLSRPLGFSGFVCSFLPVGDCGEVSFLFGARVGNHHDFLKVGKTYRKREKSVNLHWYLTGVRERRDYTLNRSPGHHRTDKADSPPGRSLKQQTATNCCILTFDNTVELFHVVMCFAVVHHCSDGEDQLRLYLRESIEHTLSQKGVEMLKQYGQTKKNNQTTLKNCWMVAIL